MNKQQSNETRPFARFAARELTQEEIEAIAGGGLEGRPPPAHTTATGSNGDDPSDPW